MNETFIHGDVTADPVLRYLPGDDAMPCATFPVAVDRAGGVEPDVVVHDVIAYRRLAENASLTVQPGMSVTVIGHLTDATPDDPDGRGPRFEATDIAVSLRYATAEVTCQHRDHNRPPADDSSTGSSPWSGTAPQNTDTNSA
jgi:single-stranded DNA-binding protein